MADDKPKAISYLMRAAKQALDTYANPEVITFLAELERLEAEGELRPSRDELAQRLYMRAEALLRLGRHAEALRDYTQALRLLGRPVPEGTGRMAVDMVRDLGTHAWRRLLRAAKPSTTGRERLIQASIIRRETLKLYFFAGQPLPGLHTLLRHLNEAEEAGTPNELVHVWVQASAFFSTLGLRRIGRSYYDSADRVLPSLDNLVTIGFAHHMLGLFHLFHGEWEIAEQRIEKTVAIDEQLGARQTEHGLHPRINLAIVWLHTGRHHQSAAAFEDVAAGARRSGYSVSEIQAHTFLAEVERRSGRLDSAREHAERALGIIGEQQFPAEKLIALSVLALTHPQKGLEVVRKAASLLKFAPGSHYSLYLGLSNVVECHLQLLGAGGLSSSERRESEKAIKLALKALHGFTRVFRFGGPAAWICEARWARRQGRPKEALEAAQRGVELARSLKMPFEEAQALRERAACTRNPQEREDDLAEALRVLAATNARPQPAAEPTEVKRAS
jgi:tetratricopeptide (TPR) repeat protein